MNPLLRQTTRVALLATSSLVLFTALGCHPYYAPPPPPPAPVAQMPPLIQLADRNGFETGRADGARAIDGGYPYAARATRAYHDCPGYDPGLGPRGPYVDAFRNAYLRGYDRGYHRG